jgi:HlyD family secretion protein
MSSQRLSNRRNRWLPRLGIATLLLLVLAGFAYAFAPKPLRVDMEEITRGPMQVHVEEDGRTRIKERFVVASPLTGRLQRIELDPGDTVTAGETLLVTIEPVDPALLDARATAEARARQQAAEARFQRTEPEVQRAQAEMDQAEVDLGRTRELHDRGAVTPRELDEARLALRQAQQIYRSAAFSREVAEFELQLADAALLQTQGEASDDKETQLPIISPITGRVLRVFEESARVVTPGESLLELGDPVDLEVVVDVLSSDAVRINARLQADPAFPPQVQLEHWGGRQPLKGVVRLVEPSGFTKTSVLGVEEQRVNVIIDFDEPLEHRAALGDGFRVEARIVIWDEDDVLIVPTSALFRHQQEWAVFAVREGVAQLRTVRIGERNGLQAELLDGLESGDRVIVYPGDQIQDGVRVVARD